jgi:CxxC motif-containing protein
MIKKTLTCIECPKGCSLTVDIEKDKVGAVTGNKCPKGEKYAVSEIECPSRVLTTTVLVEGTAAKMVSVKTDNPIPKNKLIDAMNVIKKIKMKTPIRIGDVILPNLLGLNVNLVATRTIRNEIG